jgi:hypothetical protein
MELRKKRSRFDADSQTLQSPEFICPAEHQFVRPMGDGTARRRDVPLVLKARHSRRSDIPRIR